MKWALAAVCLLLLAPLLLVDVPPLLDYPNHLARAVVLASGASDPILSRMYAAHWGIIPNLGTDLLLPPLLHVLPTHVAGRIVIGIAIVLPVLGTVAYSRALFGVASAWPFASALVAYNATLMLGFLNFELALGLALLLAAAWIAWRDRYPRSAIVLAAVGSTALFFCHLMGVVFFYLLIAGYELQRFWSRHALTQRCAAVTPSIAVPLALYSVSPLAPVANGTEWSSLADKARQLVLPFSNYVLPLDILTAGAVVGFLLLCCVSRRCRVTWSGGLPLLLTALLFVATPWSVKGTYFLDTRFVIMFGFLVFGAILPAGLPRIGMVGAVTAFALLLVLRITTVGYVWHQHRQDLAELRSVVAGVEPGARVLVAGVAPKDAPDYWRHAPPGRQLSFGFDLTAHLPALLLIERRAYWPFLFDDPSQQPVVTLSPYRILAEHAEAITDYRELATSGKVDLCGYDHLLLLNAGGARDLPQLAPHRLQLVSASDFAALFRVRKAACLL